MHDAAFFSLLLTNLLLVYIIRALKDACLAARLGLK